MTLDQLLDYSLNKPNVEEGFPFGPDVLVLKLNHMNKKHWNTILIDGTVPSKLIYELIDHSYELVKT